MCGRVDLEKVAQEQQIEEKDKEVVIFYYFSEIDGCLVPSVG